MIFLLKYIWNDFYYKNAVEMIFYYKKCIWNDFYYKNAFEMIFTIKMHLKWFLL